MTEWKKDRVFYQISDKEKQKRVFKTIKAFVAEADSNLYLLQLESEIKHGFVHRSNRTVTISFDSPYGSIGLLACRHIYSIIRELQPDLIIETGIGRGVTTTFILAALNKNGKGKLISIDTGSDVGQLVPEELKMNWEQKIGKTSIILPLLDFPSIDIFLHDSLHTYENMLFEFRWAFPKLKEGGLLLSHDIGTNNSFYDFAKEVKREIKYILTSKSRYGVGVIAK